MVSKADLDRVRGQVKDEFDSLYHKGFRGAIRKGPALSVFIAFGVGVVVGLAAGVL